ncbi:hypothetical protein HDU92_005269 [Lobulomyces angularis]|nr:hypothetical protein HDU92_005269 [Lobulomyces angularis]
MTLSSIELISINNKTQNNLSSNRELKKLLKNVQQNSDYPVNTQDERFHSQKDINYFDTHTEEYITKFTGYFKYFPPWVQSLIFVLALLSLTGFYIFIDHGRQSKWFDHSDDTTARINLIPFRNVEITSVSAILLYCFGSSIILNSIGYKFFLNQHDARFDYCGKLVDTTFSLYSRPNSSLANFEYPTPNFWFKDEEQSNATLLTGADPYVGIKNFFRILPYLIIFTSFFTLVISYGNISRQCKNYNFPLHQRYIIRILMSAPIYSVLCLLSLVFYQHFFIWQTLRDFYEAYTGDNEIKQLLSLVSYLDEETKSSLSGFSSLLKSKKKKENLQIYLKERKKFYTIFGGINLFSYNPTVSSFLINTEKYILLFIFWKLITTVSINIMNILNVYCMKFTSIAKLTIFFLKFLGVIATNAVNLLALNGHPCFVGRGLENQHIRAKMWSILFLINSVFYQTVFISIFFTAGFSYYPETLSRIIPATPRWSYVEIQEALNNILIIFEMFWLSIFYSFAFPSYLYQPSSNPLKLRKIGLENKGIDEKYRRNLNQKGNLKGFLAFFEAFHFLSDFLKFIKHTRDFGIAFGKEDNRFHNFEEDASDVSSLNQSSVVN